jgi:hypothetical protein
MQPAIDPDDGLAFFRHRARLRFVDAASKRQPARDLLVLRPVLDIRLARNQSKDEWPPFRRLSDLFHEHSVGRRVEALEVLDDLRVRRELVVGAWLESKDIHRLRDLARRRTRRLTVKRDSGEEKEENETITHG